MQSDNNLATLSRALGLKPTEVNALRCQGAIPQGRISGRYGIRVWTDGEVAEAIQTVRNLREGS